MCLSIYISFSFVNVTHCLRFSHLLTNFSVLVTSVALFTFSLPWLKHYVVYTVGLLM